MNSLYHGLGFSRVATKEGGGALLYLGFWGAGVSEFENCG
jgi:hypothetical protein